MDTNGARRLKYNFDASGGKERRGRLGTGARASSCAIHADAFLALPSRGRPPGPVGEGLRLKHPNLVFTTGISDRLLINTLLDCVDRGGDYVKE